MAHKLNPKEWVKNYADYLYNHAMYRTRNSALSEDLVQDTFVSAFKGKDNFKGTASEKTWLVTILKNKIIDHYRKASTRKQINVSQLGDKADYFFDTATEDGDNSSGKGPRPNLAQSEGLNLTEQNELNQILFSCFDKLPEKWGEISKMKLVDDATTEEITEAFNISKSNFWVILHRAKLQLRECLQHNWVNE
jgi:RNA polymerase sigma-70 factor (ECF subfamily)